jgi:hypothetical protein
MPTPASIKGDGKRTFAYMTKRGMTAQSIQTKNPEKDIYIQERTLEECSDRNSFLKLNKEREIRSEFLDKAIDHAKVTVIKNVRDFKKDLNDLRDKHREQVRSWDHDRLLSEKRTEMTVFRIE